jgi:hypothetical protein
MTATPNFASDALAEHGAGDATAAAAGTAPFVLNLCSSTTPMALAQTDLPELKRFTFFVSRRFEEGRERFRLHMGYFATLAEAEEWLSVVREIYPGAWAGEAPGRKLRERAAAAAAAQVQHAAGPQQQRTAPQPAPHPFAPAPAPAPLVPDPIPVLIPVLQAAPSRPPVAAPAAAPPAPAARKPTAPAAPAAPAARTAAAPRAPAPPAAAPVRPTAARATPTRAMPPAPAAAAPAKTSAPVATAPSALSLAHEPKPAAAAAPAPAPAPEKAPGASGVFGKSNVREVLKALGDASATGETRLMRAPSPPHVPVPPPVKESLSDTQVLKLLEVRRPEGVEPQTQTQEPAHGAIPLLKPDDTGTREALKDAVVSNAAVLFAVQLQWSVQPIELDKVPPLAIFSAYTLYTVEGSRDGRKWYGLRLGFFSDAISAKQVAHYVRSEFIAVAVVPVSAQEKARATDQDKQAATLGGAPAQAVEPVDEFKLIDDAAAIAAAAADALKKIAPRAAQPGAAKPGAAKPLSDPAARRIPGRPVPKVAVGRKPAAPAPAPAAAAKPRARVAGKVGAGEARGAQSLEETLEILGAGQLAIDNGNGETLNESGVRHLRVEVQKGSPFAKLLERLSERMKKS